MRRFSSEEKNSIVSLRKERKSLYQICRSLNVEAKNKSAVYYHIKKNFGRSYKLVKLDSSNQNLVGEIMGLFASDGSCVPQADYLVRFHLDAKEERYSQKFSSVLNSVFNKQPSLFRRPKYNSILLSYRSKIIYEFLREYLNWDRKKTHTIMLRNLNHSKDFLVGFLRGYFDGDGYSKEGVKTAQFVTTSKNMHGQLQEILSLFRLNFFTRVYNDKRENRHTAYYIDLRHSEAVKFINLIEPRNSKRIKAWARSIAWSSKLR